MSQAIKDWIEQDREGILDMFIYGDISRDEAIRELERLGFGTDEARTMIDEEI